MSTSARRVVERIAEVVRRPVATVTPDTALAELAVDSFVLVELVLELQDEFRVRFDHHDVQSLRTVRDVLELVAARAGAR
jgi:acyl carrier protein